MNGPTTACTMPIVRDDHDDDACHCIAPAAPLPPQDPAGHSLVHGGRCRRIDVAEVVENGGEIVSGVGHDTPLISATGSAMASSARSFANAFAAWLFTVPTEVCMVSAICASVKSS